MVVGVFEDGRRDLQPYVCDTLDSAWWLIRREVAAGRPAVAYPDVALELLMEGVDENGHWSGHAQIATDHC